MNKYNSRIKYQRKNWLDNIRILIFHTICNLIITSILIIFISARINKIVLATKITKSIYIGTTYLGVLSICLLGAFLSIKIEEKIKNNLNKSKEYKKNIININKKECLTLKELKEKNINNSMEEKLSNNVEMLVNQEQERKILTEKTNVKMKYKRRNKL